MKIYVTGDSWVYGDGLDNPATEAWPMVLGRMLNADVVNDACLSGSNSYFVYRTIKNLENNFDFFIVAWTTTTKFTFFKSNNNHSVHFNPELTHHTYGQEEYYKIWGRTLYQTWHNRLYALKLWLQQIIQLQTMFDRYNKNYLMINTHENNLKQWLAPWPDFIDSTRKLVNFDVQDEHHFWTEYNEIQFYVSQIDTTRFYEWNKFHLLQLKTQSATEPDFMCGGHPSVDGHIHLANMLHNSVQLQNV